MCIEYSGLTFTHAFKIYTGSGDEERLFNIMVTSERKTSVVRYVGVNLDNGLASRSKERDFNIAISTIICDIVQSSIDIQAYHDKHFQDKKTEYAGAIHDPVIRDLFEKIAQEKTSLAFYWELKKQIEYGVYFSQSRYRNWAKNEALLNFLSEIRMNVFSRPITIANEIELRGPELRNKYRISKYITKIGEILSLSRLFENQKWENFCYVPIH